ncbi:hypothetical protein QUV58_05960 [Succinatimonas hippei]|uniref:SF0329 family protein n=1 Tax=Succinatimonas hippei TaxID=626938 RepID=UPI0025A36083|nr:hypothetical protein [Succinatimonas hippei]MDM8120357.1 hypothetical protein [Succinatimonas hippei]
MRWSKLQKRIYNILDPNINLQIHCITYLNDCWYGPRTRVIPRYFITLNKKIIFDWPKDFPVKQYISENIRYRYESAVRLISVTLANYLNTPLDKLMLIHDHWKILDIIRAADRRIGSRRWKELYEKGTPAVKLVIKERIRCKKFNKNEPKVIFRR